MKTQKTALWITVIESLVWFVLDESNSAKLTKLINHSYDLLSENHIFLDIDNSKGGYCNTIIILKLFSLDLELSEHYHSIYEIMEHINGWSFGSREGLSTFYPKRYWTSTNILNPEEDDDETKKQKLELLQTNLRLNCSM